MIGKGKFGFSLTLYPILGFALVFLRQTVLCAVLLCIALFVEKSRWASRQTLQALLLSIFLAICELPSHIFSRFPESVVGGFLNLAATLFFLAAFSVAAVLSVLAIVRTMKGADAHVPLFSQFAYRLFGEDPQS